MDCPKCGLANPQSAQICDCGYSFSGERIVRRDAEPSSLVPQPWARYFGRLVDYILFSLPVGLVWGLCRGLGVPLSDNSAVSWLVAMFLWIPVEAAFIAKWGHTPGKWLLRIDVLKDGHHLSYREAMARALRVWWRGMGTGFPLVALFTMLRAYNKLKDTHASSWDRDGGFIVTHRAVSQTRWILALALWAASIALARMLVSP